MVITQPGILASTPTLARYLSFKLKPGAEPQDVLGSLAKLADGEAVVVGLGLSLVHRCGGEIKDLREFAAQNQSGLKIPATPADLWIWLRGTDNGDIFHRGRAIYQTLAPAFTLEQSINSFQYGIGLDLTGYVDGTENPIGDDAVNTVVVHSAARGVEGSSFVAVQQWEHNFEQFESMTQQQRDYAIGRRKSDNEELQDAPSSAHVKRTAQESFDPEAFVLRRSMPWANATSAGLMFVAFGKSFDAFEALLARMIGTEDGITDAIFKFTRPVTGSYFWCPPVIDEKLDLRAVNV